MFDSRGLKEVCVYVDGEIVSREDTFADRNYYSETVTINEGSHAKHIRITAADMAGNVTDTDDISFNPVYQFSRDVTISSSFFVRWYADKGVFFGSLVAVLGLASLLWIAIYRLRRKTKMR